VFRDGVPGWLMAGYETATTERLAKADAPTILTSELNQMLAAKENFVLLDIRIVSQDKERIEHAQLRRIDLDNLPDQYMQLPRDRKIVIMDLNGRRSPIAARYLLSKGFTDVVKVNGGMRQWLQDGRPVVRGN
jgi:rhodanese-related sulfurtransferase